MSQNHRFAIIGIGGIANMHANAIKDLPNAELVAGSCRGEDKGRKFADEFDCKWYSDFSKMLDEQKPDIACITTPSGFHLEPMSACADRGIHVICEKPLDITTDRIDHMIELADEKGIVLGGIFPSRFNPLFIAFRKAAAEGRFGTISLGATYVPWWRDDAYYAPERWQGTLAMDGGGALMNQSIHGVDALQWIMGGAMTDLPDDANPVEEVYAFTGRLGHPQDMIEVEDTAVAVVRFKNGALGQILGATSMYPGMNRRMIIAGRDGTAEAIENELTQFSFREKRAEDDELLEKHGKQTDVGGTGASDPLAIGHGGHTVNIESFLKALDAGKRPSIDGVQMRKAVAIIEAIYRSAASRRPEKVA